MYAVMQISSQLKYRMKIGKLGNVGSDEIVFNHIVSFPHGSQHLVLCEV